MMIPYLHFTPGDAIWFKEWAPRSNRAMVGACIGIALLAILDRLLAAMRSLMESWWSNKTNAIQDRTLPGKEAARSNAECEECDEQPSRSESNSVMSKIRLRPFVLSHDLVRGAVHCLQVIVGYLLMLVVMTFNASFIISVLAGLLMGEIIFGRYTN